MALRIVGGRLGGRQLRTPRGEATRPTAERAREALFSILFDVGGLSVLDLYAGSGAVGLEALSRGAARAVFVESEAHALDCLEKNIDALDLADLSTVLARPVAAALRGLAHLGPFDLIYADPPYELAKTALPRVLAHTEALLSPSGMVVLEHRSREAPPDPPAGLVCTDTRRYGEAALAFYVRAAQGPEWPAQ